MRHPLDGITVVAVEQAVAAPFATRQLADFGARVIKIERPGGDFARGYDRDELTAIIEDSFASHRADEVTSLLDQAGIACARLRTPEEFTRHPQLRARNRWHPVRTPGGDIDALVPPVELAGQRPVMGAVPALGEHTEAIRAEFGTAARDDTRGSLPA